MKGLTSNGKIEACDVDHLPPRKARDNLPGLFGFKDDKRTKEKRPKTKNRRKRKNLRENKPKTKKKTPRKGSSVLPPKECAFRLIWEKGIISIESGSHLFLKTGGRPRSKTQGSTCGLCLNETPLSRGEEDVCVNQ